MDKNTQDLIIQTMVITKEISKLKNILLSTEDNEFWDIIFQDVDDLDDKFTEIWHRINNYCL